MKTCSETLCDALVHAHGLCHKHYERERAGTLHLRRVDKTMFSENRDWLNAFQGAEDALQRLAKENPEIDYTAALASCAERIDRYKGEN